MGPRDVFGDGVEELVSLGEWVGWLFGFKIEEAEAVNNERFCVSVNEVFRGFRHVNLANLGHSFDLIEELRRKILPKPNPSQNRTRSPAAECHT